MYKATYMHSPTISIIAVVGSTMILEKSIGSDIVARNVSMPSNSVSLKIGTSMQCSTIPTPKESFSITLM